MPIYMDRHDVPGATAADVAHAHQEDLKIQEAHQCRAITYWFDEQRGTAFCLVEAPNKDAVIAMHDNAHGLVPHEIIEVQSNVVESFLGRINDPSANPADTPLVIRETALRAIVCVDLHCTVRDRVPAGISGDNDPQHLLEIITVNTGRFGGRQVESRNGHRLAAFVSVSDALECAHSIQREVREHGTSRDDDTSCISIALTTGTPVGSGPQLFEGAVNEALRLCRIADTGQIVLSPSATDILRDDSVELPKTSGYRYISPNDAAFLNTLMEVVESDYMDPAFRLSGRIRQLGVSYSQMYRKISSLSGVSPVEFLRTYRLRRASEHLERGAGTVSDAAFASGFTSPSYFAKCFKLQYGCSPSDYAGTRLP